MSHEQSEPEPEVDIDPDEEQHSADLEQMLALGQVSEPVPRQKPVYDRAPGLEHMRFPNPHRNGYKYPEPGDEDYEE